MGSLKYFLGLEIARNDTDIYINQMKYVLDILQDTSLQGSKPSVIPMDQHHQLASDKGDFSQLLTAVLPKIGRQASKSYYN